MQLLDLNDMNLLPDFASSTQDYTLTVSNSTTEIEVVAVAHPLARIKLDIAGDTTTATGTISNRVELRETGMENQLRIRIVVTAQDDVTTQGYTVLVTRSDPASDDAELRDLQLLDLNGMNLLPDFASSTQDYILTVSNSTTEIEVVAVAHPLARIKLDIAGDTTTATGTISNRVELRETGMENQLRIRIVVTAQDDVTTQGYTVLVTRRDPASDDAELRDLQLLDLNGMNLLPDFASSTQDYILTVSNSTTEIEVVAVAHPLARIKLDIAGDTTTATGTISNRVELRETGMENQLRIRIVVTAQDDVTTQGYTVLVTRSDPPSMNVDLETIEFEVDREGNGTYTPLPVELIPPEADDSTTYTAIIKNIEGLKAQDITRIRISPQASEDGATISINGGTAATAPTLDITLSAALGTPEEAISIKVMQNGAFETYSLIITRERDPVIRLRIKVFLEGPLQ